MELINPSAWRRAKRNTARRVSAVRIARGEYQGCPPRVVRGAARHPSIAASENHTVRLPRWRRLASYSRQFITFHACHNLAKRCQCQCQLDWVEMEADRY